MDLRSLIILAVVVSAGGSSGALLTGLMGPGQFRPDPFTGTDGKQLNTAMEQRMQLHMLQLEQRLVLSMSKHRQGEHPPDAVRARIVALERAVGRLSEAFRTPTSRWNP